MEGGAQLSSQTSVAYDEGGEVDSILERDPNGLEVVWEPKREGVRREFCKKIAKRIVDNALQSSPAAVSGRFSDHICKRTSLVASLPRKHAQPLAPPHTGI